MSSEKGKDNLKRGIEAHDQDIQSLNEENFRATLQEPLSQFRESSISGHILHLSTFRIFDMWKIPQNILDQ